MKTFIEKEKKISSYMGMSLEDISDGILMVDRSSTIVYCHKPPKRILKKRKTVIGKELFDLFSELKRTVFESKYNQAMQGENVKFEMFFEEAKEEYWYEVRLCPFEEGILILFFDITRRKRDEEHLRLLSDVLDQSGEGIAFMDMKGTLKYANNAFARAHGYRPAEIMGKHMSIFHSPEQMKAAKASTRELKAKGEFSGELWHTRRDGEEFPARVHDSILRNEKGEPNGIIKTISDLTETKRAERDSQEHIEILRRQKISADKKNIALIQLLEKMDFGKEDLEESIRSNIERLVLPHLNRLKLKGHSQKHLELMKKNLESIASSFGSKVSEKGLKLSPREIEAANMIKNGFSTKEIASLLNISPKTVERYRNNIRKKLCLVNKKVNLTTYLKNI